jgi:hypothetical protein
MKKAIAGLAAMAALAALPATASAQPKCQPLRGLNDGVVSLTVYGASCPMAHTAERYLYSQYGFVNPEYWNPVRFGGHSWWVSTVGDTGASTTSETFTRTDNQHFITITWIAGL